MTKFTQYILNKMLYETCGEDPDVIENAKIVELAENDFHITYKEDDPFDGVDFKVHIEVTREIRECERIPYPDYRDVVTFTVSESVYGDDGAFEIVL